MAGMDMLMKFLQKAEGAGAKGLEAAKRPLALAKEAPGEAAALGGIGAAGLAGGYGASELLEEDDDPLKQLLAAIGLG